MKKFLVSIMLVVLTGLTALAQDSIPDNSSDKVTFSLRLGGGLSRPTKVSHMEVFNNGFSLEVGLVCKIPLKHNLYIEPGLTAFFNRYGLKRKFRESFGYEDTPDVVCFDSKGIRIPVMAGYDIRCNQKLRLSVFTGPEFEVGTKAELHMGWDDTDLDYICPCDPLYVKGGLERFDFLWKIGAGITYNKKCYLGLSSDIGILNRLRDTDMSYRDNLLMLTVGLIY